MHPPTTAPPHARRSAQPFLAAFLVLALTAACAPAPDTGGEAANGGKGDTATGIGGEVTGEGTADTFATLPHLDRFDPPAGPGALAPQLSPARQGGVWMSWLEPTADGHRLRVSRFDGTAWSPAHTVTAENDFFANWADVPSVVEGEDGELLAHWLAKTGDDTYAYGVFLARSGDGGATWSELGTVHDDDSPTEHGFVSLLPVPGGGFEAAWLDGRRMADGGAMTLRAARIAPGATGRGDIEALGVLDERVCECCQTGAARTADGPLVAYRDRSQSEVRDIYTVRRSGDGWSAPAAVAADGWTIAGCPVNGPAVAAAGERAFLAWFTAADGSPRVRAAFSGDAGASFAAAVEVDAEAAAPGRQAPLGRVDAALVDAPAVEDGSASNGNTADGVVSWLGGDGGVWLRRVSPGPGSPGGTLHPARRVARTATVRASGFPRIEVLNVPDAADAADSNNTAPRTPGGGANPRLAVAWVVPGVANGEQASQGGVRFATLDLADLPDAGPTATTQDR